MPDLHREVHATEKRLASSEPNFRAGAPSLADSPVPDYVMFAKEFQSGMSLRSTRLKPSKLRGISIANVRTQKGPFPSLCALIAKGAAARGSAPASERRNR